MSNVGLLFVGAALFVNGLGLLGLVSARSAAPLNLFVGAMQVVLPTVGLILAPLDPVSVRSLAAIYLFGFTYLYVGINVLCENDGAGLGWFSLFVAAIALVYGIQSLGTDLAFAGIWFTWVVMWLLFFLVLALGWSSLTRATGWLLVFGGPLTATIPALLSLNGSWPTGTTFGAVAIAVLAVTVIGSFVLAAVQRGEAVEAPPKPAHKV